MNEASLGGACLLVFLAGIVGSLNPPATQVVEEPSNSQGGQQQSSTAAPLLNQEAQPLVDRECEQYPQTAEQADLCQQWRMAVATEEIERITRRQLYITVGEVVGLLAVVILTVVAVRQTHTSLGRDRAWMVFGQTEVTTETHPQHGVERVRLVVIWENAGQTPALQSRIALRVAYQPAGTDPPIGVTWDDSEDASAVGPRGVNMSDRVTLERHQLEAIRDGLADFFIYSVIRYEDIHGHSRESEFCQKAEVIARSDIDIFADSRSFHEHFRMKAYGRHQKVS